MLARWACVLVATAARIRVCLGSTTWTSSPRQKAQPANSRGQCWAPVMILWGQWGHVDYIGPLTIWGGGWQQRFVLTKIDTFSLSLSKMVLPAALSVDLRNILIPWFIVMISWTSCFSPRVSFKSKRNGLTLLDFTSLITYPIIWEQLT